ncbi:DUF1553 domain-containing protein [Neorhodopirellula pilleata]|uniref:Planctomycete cytochrome C n=1 Tax=Neorhodopirellula pilleata TaxID=2714738 RepID=A0A5C5ZY77_9BACT|nr:DUF1553 domain-containing protein [Neorhodopirellula pilleata]TWT91877.1 Planctomycete cytochrome C [Neorhodopirellula pilleata]
MKYSPTSMNYLGMLKHLFIVTFCVVLICTVADADEGMIGKWSFGSEETIPFEINGDVKRDQTGPRPPEFPDLPSDNTALRFGGKGYVFIPTADEPTRFQFQQDDEITIEAFVKLDKTRDGHQMYVIGKGRSGSPRFPKDNQNWALRTTSQNGVAKLSFLFATEPTSSDKHWHRWTSTEGFRISSGWHHIAVGYQFGDPESIRGWIDGQRVEGVWDMGGATKLPPVVDEDEVWIGSASRGNNSNSFSGWIDEVAVHRMILSDDVLATRTPPRDGPLKTVALPAVMPDMTLPDPNRVLVTFHEGLGDAGRWLVEGETWPDETTRWSTSSFLLPRMPARFDAQGSRVLWDSPVLVRIAGDFRLPAGTHRMLLRARSLSRLWIDGKLVATTQPLRRRGGNLEPIVPPAEPPFPGGRRAGFVQQEAIVEHTVESDSTRSRVVLEFVVGGNGLRVESGEVCVAIQPEGSGDFLILSPTDTMPLTDAAVEQALPQIEASLVSLEDSDRRRAAASEDDYWDQRHQAARELVKSSSNEQHSIDAFIKSKIVKAVKRQADAKALQDAETFHSEVLPILRDQCFRCHGQKQKGGLRLDHRDEMLKPGESEQLAVVPFDPDASELIVQVRDRAMPPTDEGLTDAQISTLENWVAAGAVWPEPIVDSAKLQPSPLIDDAAFIRRLHLDTIGIPPTAAEAKAFLSDTSQDKRLRWIDKLLRDDRYADHWVSLFMDLLAENPALLNPSMGSTGPFRWFLHDSLKDNMALDRMVTNLILMRGDQHAGGSAGFELAGENDSPMAAKAHLLSSAFLGIEMKCAKCHDSPYHSTTQEDLYSLAAMLGRRPLTPPKTSRVPDAFFESKERESLISVTMDFSHPAQASWPFDDLISSDSSAPAKSFETWLRKPEDTREQAALMFTSIANERFPRVLVNHLWKRLIGTGLVEPVDDWEGKTPSHPELLNWLGNELVLHDYDIKHIMRLIMRSDLYQREAIGDNATDSEEQRYFAAPDRRRLSAEQVVDSLFHCTGSTMNVEELTFVHDGSLPESKRLSLGVPHRAWMFCGLQNERDRPSLSMPRAQVVVDVLDAFGWTGARQNPIALRDTDPNVLQPGILANGTLTSNLTRASAGSELAELAIQTADAESLLESLFLRFLSRFPSDTEREKFTLALATGFEDRILPDAEFSEVPADEPLPVVTWTNHLVGEANEIQQEIQRRVQRGPAPDPRLRPQWRMMYEDVVWSLINHNEFVWVP